MKWIILLLCFSLYAEETFKVKEYPPHALGLRRSKTFLAFKMRAEKALPKREVSIPGKYDLSSKVSPPEDQGQCGSCWSFGITKSLRSALMLAGSDPGTLAFNYLLNNCGPGPKMWGCEGGDFEAGESFLDGHGPWLEKDDPYRQQDGGKCLTNPAAGTALSYKVVGDGQHAPSFRELASAISDNHMLVIDVAVCGSWGSYSSGIFNLNQCGAHSINHIINLNGYDCQSSVDSAGHCVFNAQGKPVNGDGYLIVMNNWGTGWGEKGYMRTRWGVDAVADTAMYFEVKQLPPPPEPPVPPIPPAPPEPPAPPIPPVEANIPLWVWLLMGAEGLAIVFLVVKLEKKQ